MSPILFSDSIASGCISALELLALEHNCVLWIRNKEYDQQLYVSNTYHTLWGRSCLSLYQNPSSWKDTLYDENALDFVEKLIKNRTLINPHYTELLCIKMPDGEKRWFQDRSFHLPVSSNNQILMVGCALYVGDKNEIILDQRKASDTLDYIISKLYKILSYGKVVPDEYPEPQEVLLLSKLSKREKEILKLFLNGYTAAQVAESLQLSRRTVESYLINLKNKLACESKSEMIIKAIENQWVLINI